MADTSVCDKECGICWRNDENMLLTTSCNHNFCRICMPRIDECALCRRPLQLHKKFKENMHKIKKSRISSFYKLGSRYESVSFSVWEGATVMAPTTLPEVLVLYQPFNQEDSILFNPHYHQTITQTLGRITRNRNRQYPTVQEIMTTLNCTEDTAKDVLLVCEQSHNINITNVYQTLRNNDGDLVNTIMELTI